MKNLHISIGTLNIHSPSEPNLAQMETIVAPLTMELANAAGYTKILADGTALPLGSDRTDHVAVIDHATGLMWSVNSMGDLVDAPVPQADCENACRELRLLGHDDWRLPSRSELATLVNDTCHEPAIDTNLFPGVLPSLHRTSTASAWSSAAAWSVDFNGGHVVSYPRISLGFALAVRRAGQ